MGSGGGDGDDGGCCSFAGGVGRLESGTHEARYRSSSSSSMSEKLVRMDSAGEAMVMLPQVFMAGSVDGSRRLQEGFVEGSFQVNKMKQNLCQSRRSRRMQTRAAQFTVQQV